MPFELLSVESALIAGVLLLALVGLLVARRRRQGQAEPAPGSTDRQRVRQARSGRLEAVDTVIGWQPKAARVLTAPEREALDLLRQALPDCVVLAQVPLSRFLRVPTRRSHAEWLQRVGYLNVDLLLCDKDSHVLAAIDLRPAQESERSRARHERMARVLKAADIDVHVWKEGSLPTRAQVRALFSAYASASPAAATAAQPASTPATSATAARPDTGLAPPSQKPTAPPAAKATPMPMNTIPVPDISELLAEGDAIAARQPSMEPVASTFFDDLDPLPSSKQRVH